MPLFILAQGKILKNINPNQLLTFAVVARMKSVTRAAEHLHLGQPAVSGQLKLLQERVGEPLYLRKGHHIELTPVGKTFLEYAEKVEHALHLSYEYVRCLQDMDTGDLRIGSTTTIASYFLPKYLVLTQTQYPGVRIFMNTGSTEEIIEKLSELDLGFIEGPIDQNCLPADYDLYPWREDEIVLVVRDDHELINKYPDGVPLSVFNDYQVIWREPESGARQLIEATLVDHGMEVPINIEVAGVAGVLGSVRAGLGISFASRQALEHASSELVPLKINGGLNWQLNIVAPKEDLRSRAVQAFLKLCMDED